MWNRQELKSRGKIAFKANYWKCVLVSVIFALIYGGPAYYTGQSATSNEDVKAAFSGMSEDTAVKVALAILGAVAVIGIISILLDIFVFNPLRVGCQRFFKENSDKPAETSELKFAFKNSYGNIVKTIFLSDLFLFFWSLLFIIPGIVKTYSYRMVPYIMADNPDMDSKEAITLSRNMMNGNKGKAFVLDLSFIGWYLLAGLTFGILSVFYVNPYVNATNAELYKALISTNTAENNF